jgi:hypothetical protein
MADPTLEICAIVAEIQKEYMEGQPKAQKAQAAEGYPEGDMRRWPNIRDTGISLHCGGEAIDIFFNYRFNYYDPIIDAVALVFGLQRPVKDSPRSPEYWHYERVGVPLGQRVVGEDGRNVEAGEP